MASVFKDIQNGDKASSLDLQNTTAATSAGKSRKKRAYSMKDSLKKPSGATLSVVADILLLAVIVGIVVGAWFGVRALKKAFTPNEQACSISYCVALYDLTPESFLYTEDGSYAIVTNPIWFSDRGDGDEIGKVTSLDFVLNMNEDYDDTVTAYVTVEADAVYREDTGYFVGNTRIVSGLEGGFRMNGLFANGKVVSMNVTAADKE